MIDYDLIGYITEMNNYAVKLNYNQMSIEVEWVQTVHLYSGFTNSEQSFYNFADINIKLAVSHDITCLKESEFKEGKIKNSLAVLFNFFIAMRICLKSLRAIG